MSEGIFGRPGKGELFFFFCLFVVVCTLEGFCAQEHRTMESQAETLEEEGQGYQKWVRRPLRALRGYRASNRGSKGL